MLISFLFELLALTDTWIKPVNTTTLAALSTNYTFSHSPCHSCLLLILDDMIIHLDNQSSADFLDLKRAFSPLTHKAG